MKLYILATMTALCVNTSASEKYTPGSENKMFKDGVLTLTVSWIKDKGKKYDLNVTIHNENPDKGMIVFLNDMGCKRGGTSGQLKHTFFNTGERIIDFRPQQTKSFNMVCNYQEKATGPFGLTISKVYDNPSMDGKTVGKVIATDLKWSQDDRKE